MPAPATAAATRRRLAILPPCQLDRAASPRVTASRAAIVVQRDAERGAEADLAGLEPRRPALHHQSRGDDPAPGGDARQARQRLVRAPLQMTGATGQRVKNGGTVDRVAAGENIGRIG